MTFIAIIFLIGAGTATSPAIQAVLAALGLIIAIRRY